jgi:hypothetical protein
MQIKTQIITPQIALQYLEKNNNIRTPDLKRVTRLANSIKRGEWVTTHQGIAFNNIGQLVDGQHRLLAIVEANRAIELMVATGVDIDAVAEMDRNTPRDNAVLLGVNKRSAEIVTHISRILYGGAPTRCNLQAVLDVTESTIAKLYEKTTTSRKSLTTSPVKAAFVTAYLMKPDDSMLEAYRKLVLLNVCNIEELSQTPASIRALYQRLTGIKDENKRMINVYQSFAYTLNAINNPLLKKIHNVDIEQMHKDVRQFYRSTFGL